jgi:ATP-dependent helicase/nuclease subunit A
MPTAIPHEMILASAGSGKTFQLTNRYIALMAQQLLSGEEVTPERIIAVTFTRKAAGEFFDSILVKLAQGAASPQKTKGSYHEPLDDEAAADPLRPLLAKLTPQHYRSLLRTFIQAMPRLFLGTLDSFFASILRSFPAEFGLVGDFEILDSHQGMLEREKVFRSVFRRSLPALNARSDQSQAQREFLEAFRLSTFGKEEASIRSVLEDYVDNLHGIYLHAAKETLWGNADTIWPNGTHWLAQPVDLEASFDQLLAQFDKNNVPDKQLEWWNQFRTEVTAYIPGGGFGTRTKDFLKKVLPLWKEVEAGEIEINVNRSKQKISGKALRLFADILRHLVGSEIRIRLTRTHGSWAVLSHYERTWSQQVRRQGRLTFQDMELILAGHEFGENLPRPVLSQVASEDDRMRIDYRLDARYDHWLLDEFQDTNHTQWTVIRNLVDEVVQDDSDQRTLFQVGDIKQAIYAWRGGDTQLFFDILERYNSGQGPRIKERPLNVSWRSGHDVIQQVNAVFGDRSALQSMELPQAAIDKWLWQDHSVATKHEKLAGWCALMQPAAADEDQTKEEARYQVVAGILEEVQPVARGISCAILVQSNKSGREIVDYLRTHSKSRIPVMCESEIAPATDNPVTLALLSLLKCAAHPADTFAWEHLLMTPMEKVLNKRGFITPPMLSASVLKEVFDGGFEATIRSYLTDLKAVGCELDSFSLERCESLTHAARVFDASGSRDIGEFLAHASSYTIKEPDARSAVQVMTVHKSKGLTFDCVILPELEGNKLTTVRRGIGVKHGEDRRVEWVFDLPTSEIVQADEALQTYRAEREAEAAYEELCKFYVALTRARQANYLVISPRSASATSNNFVQLLLSTLGSKGTERDEVFGGVPVKLLHSTSTSASSRQWFIQPEEAAQPPAKPKLIPPAHVYHLPPRQRPPRRTPSGSETGSVSGKQLFSRAGRFARSYGTLVHAYFEQIEWANETDAAQLHARWDALKTDDASLDQRAENEVTKCMDQPEIIAALSRPAPEAICWREKRFEIMLNGEWLSGTFDRVVIQPDRAQILDFKTDKVTDEASMKRSAENYRPQLETYRSVLSKMTGLPEAKIECTLLFTHPGKLWQIA